MHVTIGYLSERSHRQLCDTWPTAVHHVLLPDIYIRDNLQDPPSDLTAVTSINDFYDLIRDNNNVVWNNFDVDDMFVRQLINGREIGRVTRRMIIGDHPYTANRRTGEVHWSNCGWVRKMNPVNKKAYSDLARSVGHGYNGCHYCMPKIDTD